RPSRSYLRQSPYSTDSTLIKEWSRVRLTRLFSSGPYTILKGCVRNLLRQDREPSSKKASPNRKELPVADNKKCAHPNCSCTVADGRKYCSPQCETMEHTPEVDCKCGHAGCKGRST